MKFEVNRDEKTGGMLWRGNVRCLPTRRARRQLTGAQQCKCAAITSPGHAAWQHSAYCPLWRHQCELCHTSCKGRRQWRHFQPLALACRASPAMAWEEPDWNGSSSCSRSSLASIRCNTSNGRSRWEWIAAMHAMKPLKQRYCKAQRKQRVSKAVPAVPEPLGTVSFKVQSGRCRYPALQSLPSAPVAFHSPVTFRIPVAFQPPRMAPQPSEPDQPGGAPWGLATVGPSPSSSGSHSTGPVLVGGAQLESPSGLVPPRPHAVKTDVLQAGGRRAGSAPWGQTRLGRPRSEQTPPSRLRPPGRGLGRVAPGPGRHPRTHQNHSCVPW